MLMQIAMVTLSVAVAPLHVATSPQLDGRLDDPAWQTATAFTTFIQKNPDAGGPPSEPTSVRIVYDDEALWVGIDCVQQRSPIVLRLTRRDREVDSDRVEVDLDSRATGRDAFHFQANAAGVLVDRLGSTLFAVYSRSQGAARAFGALDGAPIPWTPGLGAASAQVFLLKLSYWW